MSINLVGNYMIFDMHYELEQRIERGDIHNKEQEVNFILQMQQLEEEMIQDGILCPNCKAIDSIKNKTCRHCNMNV